MEGICGNKVKDKTLAGRAVGSETNSHYLHMVN